MLQSEALPALFFRSRRAPGARRRLRAPCCPQQRWAIAERGAAPAGAQQNNRGDGEGEERENSSEQGHAWPGAGSAA